MFIYEEPVLIHLGSWISLGNLDINYGILLDSLSMSVMVPVGIVTLCVLYYALDYMAHDPNRNRFYIILSVFAIFMTVLVVSENYLMMFIGWEFVGVISYLLISFWSTRIAAMKSALSAILLNRMGDTLFVICLGFMITYFNALDFETIELLTPHVDTFILNLLVIMLLIAATAKSAQLGLHAWLLSAMEGFNWALVKFHHMKEYPNVNWSAINYLNKEKFNLYSKYLFKNIRTLSDYYNNNKNYGQSSGNQILNSSETLREITYIDNNFKYWLIGFTEGDGSFIINNSWAKPGDPQRDCAGHYNKYLEFKITQSNKDISILYYIKNNLGFGSVSLQDKKNNTYQYRVRDREGLLKIINIFNGNIILNKYNNKFKLFIDRYNEVYKTNIIFIENNNKVSLDNAWLSGFTDAEGTFTCNFINDKISIRYILSQKNEDQVMLELAKLLNGKTYILKKCNTMNMTVNYTKLLPIIKYLNIYKLKTIKSIKYNIWIWIYYNYKSKDYKLNKKLFIKNINKINKNKISL